MNQHTKSIASKVVNSTANVLSAPYRAYQANRGARYDSARKVLVDVKKYNGMPSFDDNGVTEAFKMRTAAKAIRSRGAN